ncbi:MAG: hypothetical protein JWR69_3420 [Pedosphaera sp.]|nr:hypothetical protein [Pedosphaera sp.]
MKIKHFLLILVGLALVAGVGYFFFMPSPPGRVDAEKIIAAAQAYTRELRASSTPLPPSVSMDQLITKGLLKREDVSGFDGVEVIVYLSGSTNAPRSVLMRAHLPDGQDVVVLTDGSVETTAAGQ